MSNQKYSIDEILKEAARIKEGGNFHMDLTEAATEQKAPSAVSGTVEQQASPSAPANQTVSRAARPKLVIRVKKTQGTIAAVSDAGAANGTAPLAGKSNPSTAADKTTVSPGVRQTTQPPEPANVPPPSNYGTQEREDYASRIAREILSANTHSKTQELPAAAIRQAEPVPPVPSPLSPIYTQPVRRSNAVYIPDEADLPHPPTSNQALPTEADLLKEIKEKKDLYSERRGRAEPRPDYSPRHTAEPQFLTPDANAKEATLVIDTQELRQIPPATPRMPAPAPAPTQRAVNSRTAKTQVIDPKDLSPNKNPDFHFIRDKRSVNTQRPDLGATGSLPAIETTRNYAADFYKPAPKPKQNRRTDRFIKGSVIHKSEKTDEILFTKDPPPIIERPAIIKGQTKFQKTADLQSIPEIMSVEEYKTKAAASPLALPKVDEYDYSAHQLRLDGFESETDSLEKIDENEAEAQLYERRKERVSHFHLFGHQEKEPDGEDYFDFGEEDEPVLEPISDYNSPRDRDSILENLSAREQKLSIRTIATGILTVLMLFFSVLEAMEVLPTALSDTYTMLTLLTVMLCLVVIFNLTTLRNGLFSLFRLKPDADFPVTAALFFVGAQLVYAYLTPDLLTDGLPLYPLALSFAFVCNDVGKQTMLRRVHANFEFLSAGGEKYTVQDIYDQRDTQAMCQGLLMGDPVVKHSVHTEFPTNFLEIAYKQEPADVLSRRMAPLTVLASIAIGVGAYFLNRSIPFGVSVAACAACISVPVVSLLASNTALLSMSKKIKSNGAMVNGFHGAQQVNDVNAIVFDAADLFPAGSCDLHGIKTFGGMRVDDAILQTAAVVINTKGPLQDVFDKVIVGKQSILPEVDTLVYEERMGSSCWIYGKKVLVGNRQLLLNHGVKVPPEEFETKYKHDNRYLLYLTVAGKIAAMFVVSYKANGRVKEELLRLERSGLTVLVRTSDPNISEEMLTQQYDLTEGFVRVLSSASGRIYEKYSDHCVETYPSYIVHNGTATAFISAMYASDVLGGVKNMMNIVQVFGSILGLGLAGIFAFYGGLSQMGALSVVLFQCVWSILVLSISKYKK